MTISNKEGDIGTLHAYLVQFLKQEKKVYLLLQKHSRNKIKHKNSSEP